MSALSLLGRIPAFALLVALPGALAAQSSESLPQPAGENVASAAPVSPVSDVRVQPLTPAPTDEQKGDFLIVHHEYQAAIDAYSRVAQPSAALWNKMGIAYQMLFDPKNAARCYRECLRLDPGHTGALNNLATIDDERDDFTAAERLYRQALAVNPRSAMVLKNLGTNLLLQHRYRESSEAYAQALAVDPHILDHSSGPTTVARATTRDRGEESYLEARSCARAGLDGCAIDHLRRAFNEGFATPQKVAKEDDFASLRQTPAYVRLLEEQQ